MLTLFLLAQLSHFIRPSFPHGMEWVTQQRTPLHYEGSFVMPKSGTYTLDYLKTSRWPLRWQDSAGHSAVLRQCGMQRQSATHLRRGRIVRPHHREVEAGEHVVVSAELGGAEVKRLLALLLLASPAFAQTPVTVANPSFELPVLANAGQYTETAPSGWKAGGNFSVGAENASPNAPDGVNVAWINPERAESRPRHASGRHIYADVLGGWQCAIRAHGDVRYLLADVYGPRGGLCTRDDDLHAISKRRLPSQLLGPEQSGNHRQCGGNTDRSAPTASAVSDAHVRRTACELYYL